MSAELFEDRLTTTRGMMPRSALRETVTVTDSEGQITIATDYRCGDEQEVIRRDVHVHIKAGMGGKSHGGSFGG